jgi:hypothetical protein
VSLSSTYFLTFFVHILCVGHGHDWMCPPPSPKKMDWVMFGERTKPSDFYPKFYFV